MQMLLFFHIGLLLFTHLTCRQGNYYNMNRYEGAGCLQNFCWVCRFHDGLQDTGPQDLQVPEWNLH